MSYNESTHRCCCPLCGSRHVFRSRRHDRLVYRLMLAASVRCYTCQARFLAPFWKVREEGQVTYETKPVNRRAMRQAR